MIANGDDTGHRANGLKLREATEGDRATYRRWLRGIAFFYCGLLFLSGMVIVSYSGTGRPHLTNLSVQRAAVAARAD